MATANSTVVMIIAAQRTAEISKMSYFQDIFPKPLSRARQESRQESSAQVGLKGIPSSLERLMKDCRRGCGEGLSIQLLSPPEMGHTFD